MGAFESFVRDQMERGLSILMEKRRLRGTANITRQGLQGVVTRMAEDKLARIQKSVEDIYLRRALRTRGMPEDLIQQFIPDPLVRIITKGEGLEDDLLDTANYCFIALALLSNKWEED